MAQFIAHLIEWNRVTIWGMSVKLYIRKIQFSHSFVYESCTLKRIYTPDIRDAKSGCRNIFCVELCGVVSVLNEVYRAIVLVNKIHMPW